MITRRPVGVGIVVLVSAVIATASHTEAFAQEQVDDPCLPVESNSYWTLDEVVRNAQAIARLKKDPKVHVDLPVVIPYTSKYLDCRRWIRDSETYITRELLANYQVMQGIPRLFDAGTEVALGYAGFERLGPVGGLVKGKVSKGLHDVLFADLEGTGVVPVIENMFLELQKQHPDDSVEQILGRITGELRRPGSGFTGLAPETIRFFESTVRDLGIRQMLGTWKPLKPTAPQLAAAKSRIQEANKSIVAKTKSVDEAKKQSASIGEAIKKVSAPSAKATNAATDWTRLTGVYRQLVSSSGREQAEKLLAKAATDPALQQSLGLSPSDAEALAKDLLSKAALRDAAASARIVADRSKDLALLANNLGWAEGAFQFSNLAAAASSFEQITGALAGAAGPPGPWQMVGAANGAFALAGALSNAFGGGQKKDDGLAKALGQIMDGLRSINRQIADMRQEQRDHFAYAERYLELLVQMSAADALSGVAACQRTILGYSTWVQASDTRDIRDAIARPGPASDLRQRASQCRDWLWDAKAIPVGPGGINVVYKQLLTVSQDVAARNSSAMAGFKNRGFLRLESHYPQLYSILEPSEVTALLGDRRNWLDLPTQPIDINERLVRVGHAVAADWTVGRLGGQLLSTSTIVTTAEAALLLQPAASRSFANGALSESDVADADAAHSTHASVLRDLYGLALTALAQENLIAGGPVAVLIDNLLAQGDARDEQRLVEECMAAKGGSRTGCAQSLGVRADEAKEKCGLEPMAVALTLCAQLGQRRFEDKVQAARIAVTNFPTLRQNVLVARMWRLSGRDKTRNRWAPSYMHALDQGTTTVDESLDAGRAALLRMFDGMPIVRLGATKVPDSPSDEYIDEGIFFTRLTGKCNGITERALVGSAVCNQGVCDSAVGKTKEGKVSILDPSTKEPYSPKAWNEKLCVMAPLPSAQEFGLGRVLETMAQQRIRDVVERLAMAVAFDSVYSSIPKGNHSDRWAIIDSLRPSTDSFKYLEGVEK